MRYLVTGGSGFIGGHLVEALLSRGDNVVVLDNLATGNRANLRAVESHRNLEVVLGSVMDELLVDELVERCDTVVHLAAAVGVKLIVEQPLRSLLTNIRGSENVFNAAHRYDKKVLVASTSEIYGKNQGLLSEKSDRVLGQTSVARWAYSTSKAVDEILAFAFWREKRLPTIVVRFFNTVGPRQTGAYGMVIPRLVAQALGGRDLTIYGDGTQTRCFCDVSDAVAALQGLLDHPAAVGDVFNIGSSEEVSINELAERVVKLTGSTSKIVHIPYGQVYGDQYEDMLRRVPDTSKIRRELGWAPVHDLNSIISRVIAWATDAGPDSVLG